MLIIFLFYFQSCRAGRKAIFNTKYIIKVPGGLVALRVVLIKVICGNIN